MSKTKWLCFALLSLLSVLAAPEQFTAAQPLHAAPQATGSIVGTIRNRVGAAVPNVQVSAMNNGTMQWYFGHIQPDGVSYTIAELPVGTYIVHAKAPGFVDTYYDNWIGIGNQGNPVTVASGAATGGIHFILNSQAVLSPAMSIRPAAIFNRT